MADSVKNQQKAPNKPAISLLAMLAQAGGSAKIGPDKAGISRLWIEPEKLAIKLKSQIIASKQDLIALLLDLACLQCGFRLRMQGKSRPEARKTTDGAEKVVFVTERYCENCGKRGPDYVIPDFPVFDKSGKEI